MLINEYLDKLLKKIIRYNDNFRKNKFDPRNYERYKGGKFKIPEFEFEFEVPDIKSFLVIYNDLFKNQIYNFLTDQESPFIIDCGCNTGLSIAYFKYIYPKSRIIAFEADPQLYEIAKINIEKLQSNNIKIINKAVWIEETEIFFHSEGADAGYVTSDIDPSNKTIKIYGTKLSQYINQKVDLLKIDIEGAENGVLKEIEMKLNYVEKIFIEYHSYINIKQNLDEILSILNRSGFRYFLTHGAVNSQTPFTSINKFMSMDLQINIFALKQN